MARRELDDLVAELDDFESDDLDLDEAEDEDDAFLRGRNQYVSSLWDRYGYRATASKADKAEALVNAHMMVQKFVDTFAGDRRYRVTFDPTISTAGTDLEGLKIIITPSPVFDASLTPQQAGLILTGMAAHEASHPRYGTSTASAVRRVFGRKRGPNVLSNVLDDVRIERRFAADYPGYADVFRPMLDYVARREGDVKVTLDDPLNLAVLAVRYAPHVTWGSPAIVAERDWWQAWAVKWSREDAPRRHVEGVREGLRRIAELRERRRLEREREARRQGPGFSMPEPESVKRLKEAFASLNPLQKKAMKMASQGRSGAEIAATLGLSVSDARTLLRSARAKIADARRGGDLSRRTTLARTASDLFERGRLSP